MMVTQPGLAWLAADWVRPPFCRAARMARTSAGRPARPAPEAQAAKARRSSRQRAPSGMAPAAAR